MLPSPSELGKHFTQSADCPTFLHHRPLSAQGTPTDLLHFVFGHFSDDCINLVPTAEDVLFASEASASMAKYFVNENARVVCIQELFSKHLSIGIKGTILHTVATDASWFTGPKSEFLAINIKVKNEPGSSGDPYIQNVGYYSKYLLHHRDAMTRRLPCILISVVGKQSSFLVLCGLL